MEHDGERGSSLAHRWRRGVDYCSPERAGAHASLEPPTHLDSSLRRIPALTIPAPFTRVLQLYHSQPDNALVRSNMVLKQSSDLGRTWSNLAHVWSDEAGYSSLVVLGNATDSPLGLLYARNKATNWPLPIFVAKGITFTTVEVAKRSRKA